MAITSITLWPGEASPQDVKLTLQPAQAADPGTDIYLFPLALDAARAPLVITLKAASSGDIVLAPVADVPTVSASQAIVLFTLGVPVVGGAASIVAAGIASAEALGQPALAASIGATAIASAESFGALDLQIVVDMAGIASAEAIGQPAVSVAGSAWDILDAGGIASEEAFGLATVAPYVEPEVVPGFGGRPYRGPDVFYISGVGGIPSAEAFGRPVIGLGARSRARRQREARELAGRWI